jgi:hypothetical protein
MLLREHLSHSITTRQNNYFLAGAAGVLTLFDSHAKPSNKPSPDVAQLGTTYQTLSLSLDSWSASVTSCGFMAREGNGSAMYIT